MVRSSGKKSVLITAPWFTKSQLERLSKHFQVASNKMQRWYNEEELARIIPGYDGVIAGLDPFTSKVFEKASKLRIIARRGIGYDNIDLKAAKKRNVKITVTPVPEEHKAVAEFTVSLILDLLRNITSADSSLKSGSWERAKFVGRSIDEACIGIVGLGHIGRKVAKMVRKLGARVLYYDPYVVSKEFKSVSSLGELFRRSSVVTLHVPHTNETHKMVSYQLLSKMKRGSYLVDTCRAEVVHKPDVLRALKIGILAGAAFDVFDREPPERNDPVLKMKNIIATPHIAAGTVTSFSKMDEVCVNNILRVLVQDKEPVHRIV